MKANTMNNRVELNMEAMEMVNGGTDGLTNDEIEILKSGAIIVTSPPARELRKDNIMANYGHPELGIGLKCQFKCPNGHNYYACKKNGKGAIVYFCPTCQTFK